MKKKECKPPEKKWGKWYKGFILILLLAGLITVPAPPVPSQSCQGSFHFGDYGTRLQVQQSLRSSGTRVGCAYSASSR